MGFFMSLDLTPPFGEFVPPWVAGAGPSGRPGGRPPRPLPHAVPTRTRRDIIRNACCGFGGLALASMLHEQQARAGAGAPLSARQPHFPAPARSVIFLFMAGGPSHLETFDPKPLLNELSGQPRPKEFGEAKYQFVH